MQSKMIFELNAYENKKNHHANCFTFLYQSFKIVITYKINK